MDRLSMEARKILIELLLLQNNSIKNIYTQSFDRIAREIKEYEADGMIHQYLQNLDIRLRDEAQLIEKLLNEEFKGGATIAVGAGMHQSKQAMLSVFKKTSIDWKPIERSYFRANTDAVEAMQARTIKGLNLSDRIWGNSQQARKAMGSIIQEAIAAGENPVKVAEMLQGYVRDGAKTLTSAYPNMMDRAVYLPNDLSYEALRLARTEMAAAYGEGTKRAAEISPSSQGIQWSLSNAGAACEICKENASRNNGMGAGVYKIGNEPEYPAHPNCLCVLSHVMENADDFLQRLIEWNNNPNSHEDLERWYQTVYKTGAL